MKRRGESFEVGKIRGPAPLAVREIVSRLKRGAVIPFVGAGMSANNLNGSTLYAKTILYMERELKSLQEAMGNEPTNTIFLEAFKKLYLSERKHRALKLALVKAPEPDDLLELSSMRDFRKEFAKFIVLLTTHYNKALDQQNRFYFSSYTPIEYREDEVDGKYIAFKMLEALETLVKQLRGKHQGTPRGAHGYKLINAAYTSLANRYDTHTGKRKSSTLHSDHIVWLTDILWLTIVIWLPLYPTNRELATELSLVSDRKTRTSERRLIRTAECFSNPAELTDYIRARFRKDENDPNAQGGDKNSDALIMDSHAALASAAVYSALNGQDSVIFTTNFDRGLERALEKIIATPNKNGPSDALIGYRIIYPILVEKNRSRRKRKKDRDLDPIFGLEWVARDWFSPDPTDDRNVVRWVVSGQTKELTDDEKRPAETLKLRAPYLPGLGAFLSNEDTLSTSEATSAPFPGPVVVKLHGAPLEPLGALALEEGEIADVRHYLVISEHQYIDTIIKSEDTTPEWLMSMLKQKDISFQGYSIEDWNVRLQLARQPKKGDPGPSEGSPGPDEGIGREINRSAILRATSEAEEGLFNRLGIGLASRELAHLVKLIHHDEQFKELLDACFGDRDFTYLKAAD